MAVGVMPSVATLVVDDDETLRYSLEFLLNDYGKADAAASCAQALTLARTRQRQGLAAHDLLLVDLTLAQGETGEECLRVLRAVPGYERVPAVAMTGYSLTQDLQDRCCNAGFVSVLGKPFELEELEAHLAALLGVLPPPLVVSATDCVASST